MREVIPQRLWIGNSREARDIRAVLDSGISAVIDLAVEGAPIAYPRDIVYCRFPLIDGSGNAPAVVLAAIDATVTLLRGGLPTLVTCSGGMSRSPAIVAAALAAIDNTPIHEALKRVAAVGPHDVSVTFWAEVQRAFATHRQ
jgi:protein-tyrosine phosphatase